MLMDGARVLGLDLVVISPTQHRGTFALWRVGLGYSLKTGSRSKKSGNL
jgi:hypothetical protein